MLDIFASWVCKYRWWITACVVLLWFLLIANLRGCERSKEIDRLNHNIEALQDSIHHYTTINGKQISQIKCYIADIDELKRYNTELSGLVEEYKKATHNKPVTVVTADAEVVMPGVDTVYVATHDYTIPDMCYPFDFSDSYRLLKGRVFFADNNLGIHMDPERVYMNLTAGLDDKNNVFVMTDNPYVEITSVTGFTIPKKKQPKWSISVTAGVWGGYDMRSKELGYGPGVMIGVSYNLLNIK